MPKIPVMNVGGSNMLAASMAGMLVVLNRFPY